MTSEEKIFLLLLIKDLIVRMRHWRMTIFLQILIPVGLFALLQGMRDFTVTSPVVMNESTYYNIQTQDDLIRQLNREYTVIYYVPNITYTEKIMESVRHCLKLAPDCKYCFI